MLTPSLSSLTVEPKLERLSAKSTRLLVKATVITDDRLSLLWTNGEQEIPPGSNHSEESLVFKFNRSLSDDRYSPLDFLVTLEYSLFACTDTYTNPCPVFDSKDHRIEDQVPDREGKKIRKSMKTQTLNFNICQNPLRCQCELGAVMKETEQIIAGEEETIRLGILTLSNTGSEASPTTNLTLILDSPEFRFPRTENGNCFQDGTEGTYSSRSCTNIFLNNGTELPIEIKLVPVSPPIRPGVEEISVSVSVVDQCQGEINTRYEQNLNIPVVHHWTLTPQLTGGKDSPVTWSHDYQEKTLKKSLDFTITNQGPSMSSRTRLYVYLPSHRLIGNVRVEFEDENCTQVDNNHLPTPPAVSSSPSGEHSMQISCSVREDCLVYECLVYQTEKNGNKALGVRFEFRQKEAEEEYEGMTEFSVVTPVCVLQANESQVDWSTHEIILIIDPFCT